MRELRKPNVDMPELIECYDAESEIQKAHPKVMTFGDAMDTAEKESKWKTATPSTNGFAGRNRDNER